MKVIFSGLAERDLRGIRSWIAFDDPAAAIRVTTRIVQTAELLADFPHLGARWRSGPTRALVVTRLPYRIHYQVNAAAGIVEILTIYHTKRMPPDL